MKLPLKMVKDACKEVTVTEMDWCKEVSDLARSLHLESKDGVGQGDARQLS